MIEQPMTPAHAVGAPNNELEDCNALYNVYNEVACLMLAGVDSYVHPQDISVDLNPNCLTNDFARFIRNYNMYNIGKTIGELHTLLIEYEKGLPKKVATPQVLAIKGGRIQKHNKKLQAAKGNGKGKGKGKHKLAYAPKPKNPSPAKKEHPTKDATCHHCKEVAHWRRNYLVYLAELMKKKKQVGSASTSGERKLKQGAVYLYVRNVSKNNVLYFNAIPHYGIYEIDMLNLVPNVNFIYNVSNRRAKHNLDFTYFWHYRLAHISKKRIKKLQHDGLLKSMDDGCFDQCVSCLSGKMIRKPFPHPTERETDLLTLIHTDVCGPLRHVSRQGASYFITFTEDFSHYRYVYLLKHKHEVFKTSKLTPPYTPQHNNVSEKRNHTLLNMVRSMMNLTTISLSFWSYVLESATCILNMVLTKKVDKTPYELWYGKVPNLSYLKVYRCEALVKRDTPNKLQQRSVKCIFVGYPKETMGYYFYFPPKNKIVVARYAEFFEKNLISQEASRRAVELEEIQDEDTSPTGNTSEHLFEEESLEPQEDIFPIHRSVKTHRAPEHLCLNIEVKEHSLEDHNEPTNYKAVLSYPESAKWLDAMNAEMKSMKDNQNRGEEHWTAMKIIRKYLRNTKDMLLVYGGNFEAVLRVTCYCDAGFETDKDDIKSQTGYVLILNEGTID
ncbi:retrotransposon protein, putative, ty1-copia subclass [Tanacetum coccineum]